MWDRLRLATRARIGLGRTGDAVALADVLRFQMAHARARDAVQAALDAPALQAALAPRHSVVVRSAAPDRATYLRRPDLGRQLRAEDAALLPPGPCDLAIILADGLSATAVQAQAPAVVAAVLERLPGLSVAPLVIALQARVALGDAVGAALGARLCILLVGERPGLSVADSLGAYITYAPSPGRADSERNCVSNIHAQGGLSARGAADKIAWLVRQALTRQLTGIGLKDEMAPALPGA